MSIITQAFVFERYGPRLDMRELAELLKVNPGTIHNQIGAGTFPIATYLDGGKRWADYQHVAEHIDACRARAKVAA